MIGAVLFDLDETLIGRAGAIRSFINDQYEHFERRLNGIDAATYTRRFLVMEDNGRIAKDKLYPAFVAALGITGVSAEALLEDYRTRYPTYARFNPGARETLERVRADGARTGILSNGNVEVQNGKIDALGIRDLLDTVVISEDVGLSKPDPAIFLLAVNNLNVDPESALFVGDNPQADIVGAVNAGLQTLWYRNGATWPKGLNPRADADIDHLEEVLRYPGK